MNIGERIKLRRKTLGLSAEEVAAKLGVSPATVYRYESNAILNMRIDKLEPIANVLHTTPAYLMGWEDNDFEEKHISSKSYSDPYKFQLDECYNMLNNYGKREACRRISELTEIPRYTVNSEEKEVQQTNSITFMDEENEQELSDEERQKQLAQFLKDRREGKIRFTSYAAYGGNSVEGKATTKEDSDVLSDAVKKIKAARQHKNTGEDES